MKKAALFILAVFYVFILASCSDNLKIGDVFEGELKTYPGVTIVIDGRAFPASARYLRPARQKRRLG